MRKPLKITATKEFTFDMAHLLAGHNGLCKNLHGHTYKLQVTLKAIGDGLHGLIEDGFSDSGMVEDFRELKEVVKANFIDEWDHATMIWTRSDSLLEAELFGALSGAEMRIVQVPFRPTAENMAAHIFEKLEEIYDSSPHVEVERVRLYETPTSFAEVTRNDCCCK